MTGNVFDIQRFSIHDGPGIRTTVFLKGCSLNCVWCHNPESRKMNPELSYNGNICVGCGACISVCPNGCHTITEGTHVFVRAACVSCFQCSVVCYAGALKRIGKTYTVSELLGEVVKDSSYYEATGGGLTISGGEPMAQPDFTAALLKAAKEASLHTCIETSGYAPAEDFMKVLPFTDIFLFDYKLSEDTRHKAVTGVSQRIILENLYWLDRKNAPVILRCPVIPGENDTREHFDRIAGLASSLGNVIEINILPYHPYGAVKSERTGCASADLGIKAPGDPQVEAWIGLVQLKTKIPVKRG